MRCLQLDTALDRRTRERDRCAVGSVPLHSVEQVPTTTSADSRDRELGRGHTVCERATRAIAIVLRYQFSLADFVCPNLGMGAVV